MSQEEKDIELQDDLVEEVEALDEENLEEDESLEEGMHGKSKKSYKEEDDMDDEDDEEEEMEENFKEDLDALVDSEATLSEGFRDKAGLIFEAALKTKLTEHVNRLEEQYAQQLEEETASIKADLVDKVDGYLNYVVESWVEENQLAIESGLRSEIAESFMTSLKSVFTEHYVEVPEGKEDILEELAARVESLEEDYNTAIDRNIALNEQVDGLVKEKVIVESTDGLSVAQSEKLKELVESIEFESVEDFSKKVATIKESYFKTDVVINEETVEVEEDANNQEVNGSMAAYLAALKKSN